MPIQFSCECGKQLKVRDEKAGKLLACPNCSSALRLPSAAPETAIATNSTNRQLGSSFTVPAYAPPRQGAARLTCLRITVGTILFGFAVVWAIFALITAITFAISTTLGLAFVVVTLGASMFLLLGALSVIKAKRQAIQFGKGAACWGMINVVAWDPTEGVLFLKDKKLAHVDNDPTDGGGIALMLPWIGEELAFRAPLELRTTVFEDENVLTREYVPLTIKGAIYWRIFDLARFYFSVSRSIHKVNDRGSHQVFVGNDDLGGVGARSMRTGTVHQLEAGEEWLRLIAEEQTRAEIIRVQTPLLVADQIKDGLPEQLQSLMATNDYESKTDGLAEGIRHRIEDVATDYGIHVERVSLQEVQLNDAIRQEAVAACVKAYTPLMAQREATAKKMHAEADAFGRERYLRGEANVIGKEATANKEVFGNVQPFALGGGYGSPFDVMARALESRFGGGDEAPRIDSDQDQRSQLTSEQGGELPESDRPQIPENPFARRASQPQSSAASPFDTDEPFEVQLLAEARRLYDNGEVEDAICTLQQILSDHPNTESAERAKVILSRIQ